MRFEVERAIRGYERAQNFDVGFIAPAWLVYCANDRRAELKRRINLLTGSRIVEEKSYAAH